MIMRSLIFCLPLCPLGTFDKLSVKALSGIFACARAPLILPRKREKDEDSKANAFRKTKALL
jgi:hypothetical protein